MASIFSLPPLEEGGPIARAGFEFQDHVAAKFCLQMLRDSSIRAMWCETYDDLLFDKEINGQPSVEFIQVKSDAPNQLWTPTLLCGRSQQRAGTSIIEKQITNDRGDEQSFFRLVTFRDTDTELSILRQNHDRRNPQELAHLVQNLSDRISNYQSPKRNGAEYWVNHMQWDVPGSVEAIENGNLVLIDDYLTREASISLLVVHKRSLYIDLLNLLRGLATARRAEGVERKRITRERTVAWLLERATSFPIIIRNEEMQQLVALERESVARCESRWLVLGVPEDVARNLTNNVALGEPAPGFLRSLEIPFVWLVAEWGAGKSLTAERLFQRQLATFRVSNDVPIPVFLEGLRIGGRNLREEAETQARRIGDFSRRGIFLILDGIDQAGTQNAFDLLNQAFVLSRTWQNSRVIVTSISLATEAYSGTRINLPPLGVDESASLVRRISGNELPSIHWLPHVFHEDITKPLFAVLLALRLRQNQQIPASIGELIEGVARRAIQPWAANFANASTALMRLAIRSTDAGGSPIPINEIGLPAQEFAPLLATRLVTTEGNSLGFTVTILAHWFAAEAIGANLVTAQDLLGSELRRERWRYPLSVFVGTRNFNQVSDMLEPIVREYPAFAAVVIKDALHGWHRQPHALVVQAQELANQIKRALLAWSDGIGPLAELVTERNANGDWLKMSAFVSEGRVTILWHDNPNLPAVRGIQGEPDYGSHFGTITMDTIGDQPAWVWQQMKGHIASSLGRIIQSRQLPNEIFLREAMWHDACRRTVHSPMSDLRVSIEEILNARRRLHILDSARENFFQEEIERLRQSGVEYLEAPYPQADQRPASGWIFDYFSAQKSLERTRVVYAAAMQAYLELVQTWFPKFAPRLRHFAIMPARMCGILIPEAETDHSGRNPFSYRFEPLVRGSQNEVSIEIGSQEQAREITALTQERIAQVATLRPECADWLGIFSCGSGLSDVCQDDPCTRIVYNWLESDLREVNWDH